MKLEQALASIRPLDQNAMNQAQRHWNNIAKPLHSLGRLEEAVIQIAGIIGTPQVRLDRPCGVVMCADNGVVAQGVTQSGQDVTAIVTENLAKGDTSVCAMARCIQADVLPVDIGVARDLVEPGVLNRKIRYGTGDITQEPAMTRAEAVRSLEVGIELAAFCKKTGYQAICTGEMGIGNTTTAAALASVLLDCQPELVTGYGAGLDDAGLKRKIAAVKNALLLHRPSKQDPVGLLASVGGLDIGGIAGLYLGGAVSRIPVLIDGVISAAAALLAVAIAPQCSDFMLASHVSKEPAGSLLLDQLGKRPILYGEMCHGEGTGAMAALSLFRMGLAVYHEMRTFEETDIEAYQELRESPSQQQTHIQ